MPKIDLIRRLYPRCLLWVVSTWTLLSVPAVSFAAKNTSEGFVLPSKNIYCLYLPDNPEMILRCDIMSGLVPPPNIVCKLDLTGVFLSKNGKAAPTCAGDTVAGNYPVLKYGKTWTHQGITCTAKTQGLACQNLQKHGFFLSKRKWVVY